MRFTIKKDVLLKSLSLVAKPVPSKSYIASLIFIKLTLNENGLNLIGSNETIAISTTIPYSINEEEIIRNHQEGSILLHGRYLLDIVRKLSNNDVTFELLDNSIVKINDGRSSFQLNSAQADEYPEYDFNIEGTSFTVKRVDFINMIEQTSFAAAIKETVPILTAINLTASKEDKTLTAVALDAARYSKKVIQIQNEVEFSVNAPAKTLNEIIHMLDEIEDLNITVTDKKIIFKFNNTVITSNLLNGDYPNVKSLVPSIFNYSLEVNAQEFLSALERVSLLSNEKNTIKLIMTTNEVEILSTTNEMGSANEKISNFQFNGERLEILFNSSYVIDAIKALRSNDIVLKFVAEMKPFVVKNPNDETIVELITPVRA